MIITTITDILLLLRTLLHHNILHLQFQKLSHYLILIKKTTIMDKIFGTK